MNQTDIVGRDAELSELLLAAQRVRSGQGSVRSITAQPGMGKTTLLQAFATQSAARNEARFLQCTFPATTIPLRPLKSMMAALGTAATDAATSEGIVRSLAREAARAPMALVFDDAQWADEASLDVIAGLVARLPRLPIAVTIAYRTRDRHETPNFRNVLRSLESIPTHRRLSLAKLGDREIRSIADAAASGVLGLEQLQDIVQRADGNPFFAKELARAARRGERLARTLLSTLRANLRGLSPAERSVLATAALLDVDCDSDLLVRVTQLTPRRCERLLAPALERGIIYDAGGSVTFAHALMREVLIASTAPELHQHVHTRAIDAFDDRDDDHAILGRAQHAWLANDARKYDLAASAARRFESIAPETAVRLYARALENPHLASQTILDILAATMRCASASGDFEQVQRVGERRRVELERAGEREEALFIAIRLAAMSSNTEGPGRARATLEALRVPCAAFARTKATLLQSALLVAAHAGDVADAHALLAELTPDTVALLAPIGRWQVALAQIVLAAFEGDTARFEALSLAAIPDYERAYAERRSQWFAQSSLALEYLNLGVLARADRWASDAVAGADGDGAQAATRALLSRIQRLRGEVVRAAETVDGVVVPVLSINDAPAAAIHAAAWRGDTLTIARYLDAARLDHVERSSDASNAAAFGGAYIQAYVVWGDARRARAIAARLVERVGDAHGCAEGLYLAGRYGSAETAARALATLDATAARGEHPLERAFAALLRADERSARAASAMFDMLGMPYYQALALAACGEHAHAVELARTIGAATLADALAGRADPLTPRERVVADLMAASFENTEIARVLGVSPETVYAHVSSVLAKLGVSSRRDVRGAYRSLSA